MASLAAPAMNRPQMPTTNRILKTAEPTMAPIPALVSLTNMPTREMKTSGADEPAAMNVAPATSWSRFSLWPMSSSEGMK